MWNRRNFLGATSSVLGLAATDAFAEDNPFAALEARHGGRLGVAALDVATGRKLGYRAGERFALCSTFKMLLAATILQRADRGQENLNREIAYTKNDLLAHSPITSKHLAEGHMTVGALCGAAVTESDNGAADLLLASIGGPPAVTAFARSIGDPVTRLDRIEMAMNDVAPGDVRDTTSPTAMVKNMQALALGSVLSNASRAQLVDWLKNCQTGKTRLRAGFPHGWIVGDKTGTGFRHETNDVAIAWPPGRTPIIVAVYYGWSKEADAARDAVVADVARIVAGKFS